MRSQGLILAWSFDGLVVTVDDEEVEEEACGAAAAGSNVRRDLTEWQAKHATLVLTTVKVRRRVLVAW